MPSNLQALVVALLAIVPGFIAATVWARNRTWKGPASDFRTVLQALSLSLIVQIVVLPLTVRWLLPIKDEMAAHLDQVALWLLITVMLVPVLGGYAAGRLTDLLADPRSSIVTGRVRRLIAHAWRAPAPPTIWDWLFTTNAPYGRFLIVEFKDGKRVAGVFAEGSMALTSPEPQGIFLVSEWIVNDEGDIVRPVPGSCGLMIPLNAEVRWIRVLSGGSDEQQGQSA